MQTKLSKLKAAAKSGDLPGALRIAARFPQLGAEKGVITRAWNAHQSPGFYRQIGQDPDALFQAGITAMKAKYQIT